MHYSSWIVIGVAIVLGTGLFLLHASFPRGNVSSNEPRISQEAISTNSDKKVAPVAPIPENTIFIKGFEYGPSSLTVKKGTTVTWINQDDTKHTVTSDTLPLRLDSPYFGEGEKFDYTFDTVGTFSYHCAPHPYMKASIEVIE